MQSALLEVMQEHQVTIGGQTLPCRPFLVMATQNPIESEGTYPLPEAQLDRFMFKVLVTTLDRRGGRRGRAGDRPPARVRQGSRRPGLETSRPRRRALPSTAR